jgi:hypothetical protein
MDHDPKDLIRAALPLAVLALSLRGVEAESRGREAIRAAIGWFLDAGTAEACRGHELNRYALEGIVSGRCEALGMDPARTDAAVSGIDLFLDGVSAAALRTQHRPGWVRVRHIDGGEAASSLRVSVQFLVNAAVTFATGDAMAGARAQDGVVGIELDAEAVAAALSRSPVGA